MRIGPFLSCTVLLAVAAPASPAQEAYDLIIADGFIVDGTGNPWYRADVAIAGDRAVAVGRVDRSRARRVIDAGGLWVTPGFIDPHSHAAAGLVSAELSHARPLLAQGITTVFVNPDGGGPVDLAAQHERLLEHGLGVNVAQLIGHGSIRSRVIGRDDRAPTADELDRMRALAREAMEQGAFGLSSGLFYAPGSYAEIGEVVELAKVVARYGGVYTSHIRDESDYTVGLAAAVDEVIRVAREADMRGSVTHIKRWGRGCGHGRRSHPGGGRWPTSRLSIRPRSARPRPSPIPTSCQRGSSTCWSTANWSSTTSSSLARCPDRCFRSGSPQA